jgi:hypothetical protein
MTITSVQLAAASLAWQVGETVDVWTVLTALSEVGYICTLQSSPNSVTPTSPNFQMTLSLPGFPTQIAVAGNWIVFNGQLATVYTSAQFSTLYTAFT